MDTSDIVFLSSSSKVHEINDVENIHIRTLNNIRLILGNLGTLNDPLLLRIGELLLYIWKQVFVIVILINTVQRYFFYFIEQNISQGNGSFRVHSFSDLMKFGISKTESVPVIH